MSTPRRVAFGALMLAAAACEPVPTSSRPVPEEPPGAPRFAFVSDSVFLTDFSEYPAGAAPAGWSQEWDPTPFWTVADEAGATGGRVLQWSATGQSRNRWGLAFEGFGATQDQRVYTEFRVRSLGGGASIYYMGAAAVRMNGDGADEQGYAVFFVAVPSTGAKAVVLATWTGGAYIQLGSIPVDWSYDTWYCVRLEAVGTTVRARVWERWTLEPPEWQLSAVDSRWLSGRPGVSHHDNGVVQWDVWEASTVPAPPAPPPAPPPATTLSFTFTGGAAWTLPGWTETSSPASSAWTVAADLTYPDGRALRNVNTATGRHILRLDAVPDTVHDQEVLVKLRMAADNGRGPGVALRHTMNGPSETAYVAYLRPAVNQVEIDRFMSGSWAFVAAAPFPNDPGAWYWLRFRAVGTQLMVRVWPDGTPEPAAWTATATDTGIGAGSVGAYAYEPNTVDYDLFTYASAGGTAPTPAAGGPAPSLSRLFLLPTSAVLPKGGLQQFSWYGRLVNGDSVAVPVGWSAAGGLMTPEGMYAAGNDAGLFRVIATHQGGIRADTTLVRILMPPWSLGSVYSTGFAGYPTDSPPFDWQPTSAPAGVTWTVVDEPGVEDARVLRAVSTTTARHILRSDAIAPDAADQEVLARVRMADGDGRGPGVALRHTMNGGSETAYVAYLRPNGNTLEIDRFLVGAWKWVGEAGFVNDPGVWYWIRFRAEGTTLKARAWPDGTIEPAAWTLVATDTGIAAGAVGVYVYEPNTVDFDGFAAVRDGGTAPTP